MQYFECLVGLSFRTDIGAPCAIKKRNWNTAGNKKPQSYTWTWSVQIRLSSSRTSLKHLKPMLIIFDQLSGACLTCLQLQLRPGDPGHPRPQPLHSAVPPIVPPMPAAAAVHLFPSFPATKTATPVPRRPPKSRGRGWSPEQTYRGVPGGFGEWWNWF